MAQGAAIGLGALFMECNENSSKQASEYREKLLKTLKNEGFAGSRRTDTVLRRQGALLGAGLLDAGGRNLILQLRSPLHTMRREATICCFLACQLWEWYPLFNLIMKALTPSALLAVDTSMKLPRDFSLHCKASPDLFDYVPAIHKDEEDVKNKKSSVQFSFQQTRSTKATLTKSLRRMSTQSRSTEKEKSEKEKVEEKSEKVEEKSEKEKVTEKPEEKDPIPEDITKPKVKEFEVTNGARITPLQLSFLTISPQRFSLVLDLSVVINSGVLPGVLVLNDTAPNTPCSYLDLKEEGGLQDQKCPEPFVYHIPEAPKELCVCLTKTDT